MRKSVILGVVLAADVPSYSVYITPNKLTGESKQLLARILGVERDWVYAHARELGADCLPVMKRRERLLAHGHDARFRALAQDPHGAIRDVDVAQVEPDELREQAELIDREPRPGARIPAPIEYARRL